MSFAIESSRVLAVIGPNGAGKSTLINRLSGAVVPKSGTLRLDGWALPWQIGDRIVARGITRTFKHARLFPHLTILEYVLLARNGDRLRIPDRVSAGAAGDLRPGRAARVRDDRADVFVS